MKRGNTTPIKSENEVLKIIRQQVIKADVLFQKWAKYQVEFGAAPK